MRLSGTFKRLPMLGSMLPVMEPARTKRSARCPYQALPPTCPNTSGAAVGRQALEPPIQAALRIVRHQTLKPSKRPSHEAL